MCLPVSMNLPMRETMMRHVFMVFSGGLTFLRTRFINYIWTKVISLLGVVDPAPILTMYA